MNKILKKLILILYFVVFTSVFSSQSAEIGGASFYADKFDGRKTASGAIFRQNQLTAAHRTLPFGSRVRVTNLGNNKTVDVTINDRGPFSRSRIIDLSKSGARQLDFIRQGVAKVRVEVLSASRQKARFYPQKSKRPVLTTSHQHSSTAAGNALASADPKKYYHVITKRISPTGFGIQVASYQEAANLIKRCDDIKNKTNQNILVQIGSANGQKVYRIIVGNFPTRQQAESFNQTLRNSFSGSFVVAF